MGQTWGINRTMAEIHALLYITGQPLCTDDVMERLNISRGNASMSLRALCDWGIIRRLHKRGERREYFESLSRRVGDVLASSPPSASAARWTRCWRRSGSASRCSTKQRSARPPRKQEAVQLTRQRLAGMEEFMEVTNKIFQQFIGNAKSGLTQGGEGAAEGVLGKCRMMNAESRKKKFSANFILHSAFIILHSLLLRRQRIAHLIRRHALAQALGMMPRRNPLWSLIWS